MAYDLTILDSEDAYRQLYEDTYCGLTTSINTHDGINVRFFPDRFDHAFFESVNRREGDKSSFSSVRAERILWIKETLEDPTAILKSGWDSRKGTYNNSSRVAIVKDNYVVVISIHRPQKAKFITAYVADNSIEKIMTSPEWEGI